MKKIILIVCSFLLLSCNNFPPGKFWRSFEKSYQVQSNSAHGPWGGTSEIIWQSNQNGTFLSSQIINFAETNGWRLVDSIEIIDSALSFYDDQDYALEIIKDDILFNHKIDTTKVYIFASRWVAVRPGNETETENNGFILLNNDGTKLIMFQRWGE